MKNEKYLFLMFILSLSISGLKAQFQMQDIRNSSNLTWGEPALRKDDNLKLSSDASATKLLFTATCFCKVSMVNLTNVQSASGVCLDLTNTVNTTYSGAFQENEDNRNDCNTRCTDATANITAAQKQTIADCACSSGLANGSPLRSYSAVGTKKYKSAQYVGQLVNTPAVIKTVCTCPAGWASNMSNVVGGVTADGKCKKEVGACISITPLPPNGTLIGNWGFTWGNTINVYGTSANGGAAVCVTSITSPAVCKIM